MAAIPSLSSSSSATAGPAALDLSSPFINNAAFVVGGSGKLDTNQATRTDQTPGRNAAPDASYQPPASGFDLGANGPVIAIAAAGVLLLVGVLVRRG